LTELRQDFWLYKKLLRCKRESDLSYTPTYISLLLKVLLTRLLDTDVDVPYVSEIFDFVSRILEKDDRNTETIIDTIEEAKNNIVQEINSATKKILDDALRRQLNTLMGDSLGLIVTIQHYYDAPNEHFLILTIHSSYTVSKKILLELEQINSHPAFVIESFRIYFICVCVSAMAMYERKSRYVSAGQDKSISKRMSKEFEEVMKVFQKVSDKLYSITHLFHNSFLVEENRDSTHTSIISPSSITVDSNTKFSRLTVPALPSLNGCKNMLTL
jgi:hypothetical protein